MVFPVVNCLRLALRRLTRSRRLSCAAMLLIAVASGGTGCVLLLLDSVVLRPLRVPHPRQLAVVTISNDRNLQGFVSLPALEHLRRDQDVFEGLCATTGITNARIEISRTVSIVSRESVSGECGRVLGVSPLFGRTIGNDEFSTGELVVVISARLWRSGFGAAQDVLGRTLKVEGVPLTIIGVMPPAFSSVGVEQIPDVIVPLSIMGRLLNTPAALRAYYLVGRLRPGLTLQTAALRLEAVWPRVLSGAIGGPDLEARSYMRGMTRIRTESGATGISNLRKRYGSALRFLGVLTGALWIVAAVNVSGLLLTRAIASQTELATHVALGATRTQMSGLMLLESLVLSTGGIMLGIPLVFWWATFLANFVWTGVAPLDLSFGFDRRMLAILALLLISATLVMSMPPILYWRTQRSFSLAHSWSRSITSSGRGLSQGLALLQLAASVAFVSMAVLLARQILQLGRIDPGYRVDGLVVSRPAPVPGPTPRVDLAVYQHQLMDKIARVRGATAVTLSHQFPFATSDGLPLVHVAVAPADPESSVVTAFPELVSPGFFRTVGIAMFVGRDFDWADDAKHPRVVIINKTLAEQLCGSANGAVGLHIREAGTGPVDLAVIGVVADASPGDPRIQRLPTAYRSIFQEPALLRNPAITVRVADDPHVSDGIRNAVESFGYNYVSFVRPVREQLDRNVLPERMLSLLSSFVGTLSALLGALGIYALLSYNVAQRLREIGVRFALGATPRNIAVMIASQASRLAAGGLLIGIPLVWAIGKAARSLLFMSTAQLVVPSVIGSVVVVTAVLIATVGPAIRASRIEPAAALRGN